MVPFPDDAMCKLAAILRSVPGLRHAWVVCLFLGTSPGNGNKQLLEFQVAKYVDFVYSAFRERLALCGELVYNQNMFKRRKLLELQHRVTQCA
jgi:hypothetical protein